MVLCDVAVNILNQLVPRQSASIISDIARRFPFLYTSLTGPCPGARASVQTGLKTEHSTGSTCSVMRPVIWYESEAK
jgi:hypothetical protein